MLFPNGWNKMLLHLVKYSTYNKSLYNKIKPTICKLSINCKKLDCVKTFTDVFPTRPVTMSKSQFKPTIQVIDWI